MTGTSANDDCVADGIPMGLEQMQEYLQGLVIGERCFFQNYGYTICEYIRRDEVNELLVPDNLLSRLH